MKEKKFIITSLLLALLLCLSTSPAFAASLKAVPSAQTLTVNGTVVDNIPVYNINGYNYFKLRDIAYYLDYEVEYLQSANTIMIMRGGHGSTDGLSKGKAVTETNGVTSSQKIFIDTNDYSNQLHPVNIAGSNYFQLRELGQYAAFGVQFDSLSNSILVNSNYNYSKDGLTSPKEDGWKTTLAATLTVDKETVKQTVEKMTASNNSNTNTITNNSKKGLTYVDQTASDEMINLTFDYSTGYTFLPTSNIFLIQKDAQEVGFALWLPLDYYKKERQEILSLKEPNVTVLDSGTKNGNEYVFYYAYDGSFFEYDYIIKIAGTNSAIVIGSSTSKEDAEKIFDCFSFSPYDENATKKPFNGITGDYNVGSIYGPKLTAAELADVKTEVEKFVYNFIADDMTDLQKISTARNYLMTICEYAPDWSKNRANTAWGALVYHEAQCSGYARAFKALCDGMGIECYYVHADKNASNPSHQWNVVKIDGVYRIVDVQSDDKSGNDLTFLTTDAQYKSLTGMSWDKTSVPKCI